jgi:ATP-dependent Zn protease
MDLIIEIKKFLNDKSKKAIEISFNDFDSSLFQGIKIVKKINTNLKTTRVLLIKNPQLNNVTFVFRDCPKYQFSLVVDTVYLYNDNNSKNLNISKFINDVSQQIKGNIIEINSYSISVYAHEISNNTHRGLNSNSFNQIYSFPNNLNDFRKKIDDEPQKDILNNVSNILKEVNKSNIVTDNEKSDNDSSYQNKESNNLVLKKIIGWVLIILGIGNFIIGFAMLSDGVIQHGSQTPVGKFIFGLILILLGKKISFSNNRV